MYYGDLIITLSEEINQVFQLYKESIPSFKPTQTSKSDILKYVTNSIEFTPMEQKPLSFQGLLQQMGIQNESGYVNELSYLTSRKFVSPYIDNANLDAIYARLLAYQEAKKEKFIGANYDKELIKDHRYLVIILIARKLSEIAETKNIAHRIALLKGLIVFIDKVCATKLVTTLASVDKNNPISLQDTLAMVRTLLEKEKDEQTTTSEQFEFNLRELNLESLTEEIDACLLNGMFPNQVVPPNLPYKLTHLAGVCTEVDYFLTKNADDYKRDREVKNTTHFPTDDENYLVFMDDPRCYRVIQTYFLRAQTIGAAIEKYVKYEHESDERAKEEFRTIAILIKDVTVEDLKCDLFDRQDTKKSSDEVLANMAALMNKRNNLIMLMKMVDYLKKIVAPGFDAIQLLVSSDIGLLVDKLHTEIIETKIAIQKLSAHPSTQVMDYASLNECFNSVYTATSKIKLASLRRSAQTKSIANNAIIKLHNAVKILIPTSDISPNDVLALNEQRVSGHQLSDDEIAKLRTKVERLSAECAFNEREKSFHEGKAAENLQLKEKAEKALTSKKDELASEQQAHLDTKGAHKLTLQLKEKLADILPKIAASEILSSENKQRLTQLCFKQTTIEDLEKISKNFDLLPQIQNQVHNFAKGYTKYYEKYQHHINNMNFVERIFSWHGIAGLNRAALNQGHFNEAVKQHLLVSIFNNYIERHIQDDFIQENGLNIFAQEMLNALIRMAKMNVSTIQKTSGLNRHSYTTMLLSYVDELETIRSEIQKKSASDKLSTFLESPGSLHEPPDVELASHDMASKLTFFKHYKHNPNLIEARFKKIEEEVTRQIAAPTA